MQQLSLHCLAKPLTSFQKLHRRNNLDYALFTVLPGQCIIPEFNCNYKIIIKKKLIGLTYSILHLITVLLQVILDATLKEI